MSIINMFQEFQKVKQRQMASCKINGLHGGWAVEASVTIGHDLVSNRFYLTCRWVRHKN